LDNFFDKKQIELIKNIAFEAGEIAKKFWISRDFQINKKADGSRVTSADIAVSKFIAENLKSEFPQIPIICEEGNLREAGDIFWLIDPIDGTSSFIEGSTEFAVNIALVQNKKAIFGLIYAPLFEGGKMVLCNEENQVLIHNNDNSWRDKNPIIYKENSLRIITSSRTKDADIVNFITQIYPKFIQNFTVEKLSSAVKFFRILEKEADLYFHFRPSMEWDIAAGQALIELMGGKVKKLFFNQNQFVINEDMLYLKPQFTNSFFVALINEIKP
jgi:3'(2'), 5'-bisphosphate nucleotidase